MQIQSESRSVNSSVFAYSRISCANLQQQKSKQAIASKLGVKNNSGVVKKSKAAAGKATTLAGKASEAAQRVATAAQGAAATAATTAQDAATAVKDAAANALLSAQKVS